MLDCVALDYDRYHDVSEPQLKVVCDSCGVWGMEAALVDKHQERNTQSCLLDMLVSWCFQLLDWR